MYALIDLTLPQRILRLERLLVTHLTTESPNFDRLNGSLDMLRQNWGRISVTHLADSVNYSRSQLTRLFNQQVGASPKQIIRQIRFLGALLHINQTPQPDWANLAKEHGYSDQSHFVNEFTKLAGLTPTEFIYERDHASFFQDEWGTYS